MDKARREEILAEMTQDTERMWSIMDKLRKGGSRPVSLADLEQFRNEATDAMDSFRALCVAIDAHERECAPCPPIEFTSPVWEPCDTGPRSSDNPVRAWDARVRGDLWTLEFTATAWRLWGPTNDGRVGPTWVGVHADIVARHLAHQMIKDHYCERTSA